MACQGQVRRSVIQLAEHVEDRPCLGGDLQVPENKADIAQSRPGSCCGHPGSTRCVISQCATKQSVRSVELGICEAELTQRYEELSGLTHVWIQQHY